MPIWMKPLADPAVELVVIATPHDSHADLAVTALLSGQALRRRQGDGSDHGRRRPDDRCP